MVIGITGCTGGLGKRLTEILIQKKFKIKALVRKTSDLSIFNGLKNIEFIYGDISDYKSLINFIKDIDICYHLAAQIGHTSKKEYLRINVDGTDNICKSILEYNPNCRLIYCSTISTLRVKPLLKIKSSTYAISKYKAEQKVLEYIKNKNLRATIIYPGLIYGPYDKTIIPITLKLLKYNKLKLIKGGEDNAPLIYVDELCDLLIKAGTNKNAIGKRYISVKGLEIGIHDFIKIIADKYNYNFSNKSYSKFFYMLLAAFVELLYKLKKKKPPLTKSIINVLSINFKNYKKRFDNAKKDLDWEQNTTEDFIYKKIEKLLSKYTFN
jgi:nucleoside-diphosphate-sugar epimerase